MKSRYTITLIGTVLAMSALSLPLIISETSPNPSRQNNPDLELIDTLVEFGCNELAINYLMDSSNLLDKEFGGVFKQNFIGLPDDLSEEDLDKCIEIAFVIRESNETIIPEPEPHTKVGTNEICGEGTNLVNGICMVDPNHPFYLNQNNTKWGFPYAEKENEN